MLTSDSDDSDPDTNLRIASLQCLSQLALDSGSCNRNMQQGTNLERATEILINEQAIWPEFLYHYLFESGFGDHSIQRAGLSCLTRLAKSGLRFYCHIWFHEMTISNSQNEREIYKMG